MSFIRTLVKNNKGATAIEYGLIAALIAVAAHRPGRDAEGWRGSARTCLPRPEAEDYRPRSRDHQESPGGPSICRRNGRHPRRLRHSRGSAPAGPAPASNCPTVAAPPCHPPNATIVSRAVPPHKRLHVRS